MASTDPMLLFLVGLGSLVMALIFFRAIGQNAVAVAYLSVEVRRAIELQKRQDNAAAEALGRAAAQEPLALNPDGSIEEPIIGIAET